MNHDLPSLEDRIDVQLDQAHAAVQRDLASTLPIEDGLFAIIGPEPVTASLVDSSEFKKAVDLIAALPLRERLAIRPQLPTAALGQVRTIMSWIVRARIISFDRRPARTPLSRLIDEIENHEYVTVRAFMKRAVRGGFLARNRVHELAVGLALDLHDFLLDFGANNLGGPWGGAIMSAISYDFRNANTTDRHRAIAIWEACVHSVDVLVRAVDNLEGVDLTQIDLGDLYLTGIRWSEFTTRWPSEWEERIRQASTCIDQARGLWEIRDDPRIRDHRDTQVSV